MTGQPKTLINDATSSAKGTILQIYIAVQKCFEMASGQKVLIEKLGDVTIEGEEQIEVKQYEGSLTDSHVNVWKTLKNWTDAGFKECDYKSLLLYTTQKIGEKSRLKDWNSEAPAARLKILKGILNDAEEREKKRVADGGDIKKVPESLQLQRTVLDAGRETKLQNVIERLTIAADQPGLEGVYLKLKEVHCKGILTTKADEFLNSLLGFVQCPKTIVQNGWEITYDDFSCQVRELTARYCKGTRRFPTKYQLAESQVTQDVVSSKNDKDFVKKIREIEYEQVLPAAIRDYIYASETVLKDFRDYEVFDEVYQQFAANVLAEFRPKYSIACRNVNDVLKESKNFYDQCISSPPPNFPGFDTPNHSFRNGVLHMQCDELGKDIQWKLVKQV